jgi:hypothetical protein
MRNLAVGATVAERTGDEIRLLRGHLPYGARWERKRLGVRCPACGQFYIRGNPGWRTCLACELDIRRWEDTRALRARRDTLIDRAMVVFPGSAEPIEAAEPGLEQLGFGEVA